MKYEADVLQGITGCKNKVNYLHKHVAIRNKFNSLFNQIIGNVDILLVGET